MKLLALFFVFTTYSTQVLSCESLSLNELNGLYHKSKSYLKWKTTFKETSSLNTKGSILLVHGLNNNNHVFKELEELFLSNGLNVLNLALYGHRGDSAEMKEVSVDIWRDQLKKHICFLKSQSDTPVYALGYSLGSLLITDYTLNNPKDLSKVILIALPLVLSKKSKLVKSLFFLGNSFTIPSLNLRDYRAEGSTTMAAYKALFALNKNIRKNLETQTSLSSAKALVFLHDKDETLNATKVRDLLRSKHFTKKWTVFTFKEDQEDEQNNSHGTNHLMIDSYSLGNVWWSELTQKVTSFIDL